ARATWAVTLGEDGRDLLRAAYAPTTSPGIRDLPAVQILRQVWLQQYQLTDAHVAWREDADLPPAERQIRSPHDPQARLAKKRTTVWTGYKVHLSEQCHPEIPRLITQVTTTPAPQLDHATIPAIQQEL